MPNGYTYSKISSGNISFDVVGGIKSLLLEASSFAQGKINASRHMSRVDGQLYYISKKTNRQVYANS